VATGLAKGVAYEVNQEQDALVGIKSGWFRCGPKRGVPKTACCVGHFRECYVWVEPSGTKELAEFTRATLKLSSPITERQVFNAPSGVQFSPGFTR
jgi:hypothetical protein